ncbi:hypothetical protein BH23PLA1_BH23PLA1_13490 [soil metagenome]
MTRIRPWQRLLALGLLVGLLSSGPAALAIEEGKMRVYVGTYTRGESQGIYQLELDPESGALTSRELAGAVVNPSFLAIHPNGKNLYAVNEVSDFKDSGSGGVAAFEIDPQNGRLSLLGQQPSKGGGPCHIVVDPTGRNALVANYGGGSATVLPIRPDGSLDSPSGFVQHEGSSVNPQRQQEPHAHSINLDPAGRFAFVADLGLDKVLIYQFDPESGTITPNASPSATVEPGSGPRHFAFHPNGRLAYVINEMTSTVTAFSYDPDTGALTPKQTITTLPEGFVGNNSTAEIVVHPSGQFLYGSNRGHDSIAIFAIDESSGELQPVGHESTRGETPRNFNIDPSGRFLLAANQESDTIAVFRIDEKTGQLSPVGEPVNVPSPVCIKFLQIASSP